MTHRAVIAAQIASVLLASILDLHIFHAFFRWPAMNRVPDSASGRPFVVHYPGEIASQGSAETAISIPLSVSPSPSADLRQSLRDARIRRNKIATLSCIAIGTSGTLLSAGFGVKVIVDSVAASNRRQQQLAVPNGFQQFDDANFGKVFACIVGLSIGGIVTAGSAICAKVFWQSWSSGRAATPPTQRESRATPTQARLSRSPSAVRVRDAVGSSTSGPFGSALLHVEQAPTDVESSPTAPGLTS